MKGQRVNDRERLESQVARCYSTWAEDYFDNYYGDTAGYPPVHATLIRELLINQGCTSILDAGCGPASFLRFVADLSADWYGFDLTEEMVQEARNVLQDLNRPVESVWAGSVLEDEAFFPKNHGVNFDAVLLVGVLPHTPIGEEVNILRRMKNAAHPGALLIAEARNALFSLFTMNRPTYEFLTDRLIRLQDLSETLEQESPGASESIRADIRSRLRMDLPLVRGGKVDEPGYDEIQSVTHVPFELQQMANDAGWTDTELLFCHYHALPPMYTDEAPSAIRDANLRMENPADWRGLFMASTVLVIGRA